MAVAVKATRDPERLRNVRVRRATGGQAQTEKRRQRAESEDDSDLLAGGGRVRAQAVEQALALTSKGGCLFVRVFERKRQAANWLGNSSFSDRERLEGV